MHGTGPSESASSSKRRRKSIQDAVTISETGSHMLTETSKVSDDGKISEIDFIGSVRSVAKILYEREKKEKMMPIYEWMLLRADLESRDACLTPFLNLLEKLISPTGRDLVDHTISQRQKGLSFLCYFLAGIGNKQISALRKDIAMFMDHSGTSDRAIDALSNMQLSSTSRENRREKTMISMIHRDNVTRELVTYGNNAIIANIDDYHNIHGLRIPTTTSTSSVAHMTTILAIPVPTAAPIPKNSTHDMCADEYSVHNPLIVDSKLLISQIEDRYMASLSQSFNDRFAKRFDPSENDLIENLTVHCYDADIHEKQKERQLGNTFLVEFIKLDLHSTEAYIKAMEIFTSFPEFHKYLQGNIIPLVADWPGQIHPRKAITMHQQQSRKNIQAGKIPEVVDSFIPIMGPLHVSLNSRETVVLLFHTFFNSAYKHIFGTNKRLANKPRPWRINLLLQLMSDGWKNVASHITGKLELLCSRDIEYLTLKTLLDDTIPLVLNIYATIFRSGNWEAYIEACVRVWCMFARFKRKNYNKAPLVFLSDVWYWENIKHPILKVLKEHLVVFNDYPVENYHSLIRRQTSETDTSEQLSRTAHVINYLRHDNAFQKAFVTTKRYPYCKEDLTGLTNRASTFLLELFTKVKNNVGKSKFMTVSRRGKNRISCHLVTLNMDVDERHLPMAFSSEYPPFDLLEKCDLRDSCKVSESGLTSHVLTKSISLICGHAYHQHCLEFLEYKCFYCLNYIKNEVTNNVKSIISRITDQNSQTEADEDELEIVENDEPDELEKQTTFNSQAANELKMTLEMFMKI